jgi:AraC family transcriptional regulator of adaptative response / DNA-3-methyladenine glycosylase II
MDSGSSALVDRSAVGAGRELDHSACYEAIRRRDARFDGHFYTAVTTTGIFCRPSCPARTPRSSNVRFYNHAAAASNAGFRPCRRCRPELAPGHPEWNRRTDLVGKALAQIEQGVVDTEGVAGLAANLGVSERHLRRELNEVVGAGPNQLARTRRLWLARLMLDQTNLAITDVAFASGFSSVRQFNDAFRQAFDATPTSLRRRPDTAATGATELTLTLQCRGSLQWPQLHRFLSARAIDGVEQATSDVFRRAVDGGTIELGTDRSGQRLMLRCSLDRLDRVAHLIPLVRQVADLDADLESITEHLGTDPELRRRLDHTPLPRVPGAFDPFELAVRAVIGQQVSVAGARTTLGKLVALATAGTDHEQTEDGAAGPQPLTPFPTAEQILNAPLDRLGVPSRRRETVKALAAAVAGGSIDLSSAADRDQTTARLLDLPGIGPWTAGYIAMRGLNDPNGWPVGDLVLRNSLNVDAAELERRADRWKPWRGYAALLLWNTSRLEQADPRPPTAKTGDQGEPR